MIKSILLFSILSIALNSTAQIKKLNLVGIWQDEPIIASGWSNNYQFFNDGRFSFNHNQMDCADSILTESGKYKVKKHGKVILLFVEQTIISGGDLIPSTGSCGSDFELVGGTEQKLLIKTRKRINIGNISKDVENNNLITTTINNVQFWKMGVDPNDYF